jgi:Tfp pilus assembly protein PilO
MDKMKQWALLTVVVIVAVAVGGWFVLISPQRSKASDLHTQTSSQADRNQQLRAEIASLQAQHKGLPQVQAELAKLGVQLPNNPGLPALIRSLSSAADAAGVDLISLAPQPPVNVASAAQAAPTATASPAPGAATSTSTTATAAGPVPAANVGTLQGITISVVVNGGYFQVEQFVSNLEALTRPFLTSGVTMAPQAVTKPADPAAAASTTSTSSNTYDGHVQATVSGQVFMVSGARCPSRPSRSPHRAVQPLRRSRKRSPVTSVACSCSAALQHCSCSSLRRTSCSSAAAAAATTTLPASLPVRITRRPPQ